MSSELKKIIIISVCLVCLIALILIALFVDLDLKIVKFTSINSLLNKHSELSQYEAKLTKKQDEYNNTVKKMDDIKETFESEKTKYDSISDETVNIIKEATTEENYNIEYMWIRLGNYAKSNNLSIVMAEPGGSFDEANENKNGSSSSTSSTTSGSTSSTTTTTTTSTSNNANSNNTSSNTNNNGTASDSSASQNSSPNTIFKIQVSGSYLDVSDFIFEVENDKALRFKLDNISMDYVSGTTIKASFDVKNLIINK